MMCGLFNFGTGLAWDMRLIGDTLTGSTGNQTHVLEAYSPARYHWATVYPVLNTYLYINTK